MDLLTFLIDVNLDIFTYIEFKLREYYYVIITNPTYINNQSIYILLLIN